MIRYTAALNHAVILAKPKPKPIVVETPETIAHKRDYAQRNNCRKAMNVYAARRGRKRTEFTIIKLANGRFRFVPSDQASST